ncbi:ribosome maturation factor RimM [Halomonas sp. 18H]|uniref:ribosome maturation factor RimM n=1 Tax=Halomonas almeriensis TaxID=308163 RepID=UPI002230F38B|nr:MULTISPECIES: ribosome maturation factor RimM [Halomonas]MCW4152520.1 ribosome maturation factor RimM [Halomonas sp. 18H]MDN3553904.1 ribosome maturation factor RimM [Halomonas almeriensis]
MADAESTTRMSAEQKTSSEYVVLGKLTSPYGVKGWLKVYSYTSPMESILEYNDWVLRHQGKSSRYRLIQGRLHGKGLVARLEGVDGRDQAEALAGAEILLPTAELPELPGHDDFYWYQLEGLAVETIEGVDLGVVDYLFETGANDVLVIKAREDDSHGVRERLLPFLPEEVIKQVDLDAGRMVVDWDPAF